MSNFWDITERITKVVGTLLVPLIIGYFAGIVQERLSERGLSRDYVQLAVSILKEPEASKTDPLLRTWAVDLLNQNSPIKLSPNVARKLKAGEISLPVELGSILGGGGLAVSPDGKFVLSVGQRGDVRLWDIQKNRPVAVWLSHAGIATSVAFSPDGKMILLGSTDGSVTVFEGTKFRMLVRWDAGDLVTGVAFSRDGEVIFALLRSGAIKMWEMKSGRLIRQIGPAS